MAKLMRQHGNEITGEAEEKFLTNSPHRLRRAVGMGGRPGVWVPTLARLNDCVRTCDDLHQQHRLEGKPRPAVAGGKPQNCPNNVRSVYFQAIFKPDLTSLNGS